MKKIFITLFAALICITSQAQTKKADRLFEQWDYYKAAQEYEKAAEKDPSADVYFKLGECYRKMNQFKKEEAAYNKVNAAGTYHNPEFYISYGQVLKTNGKNQEAKIAFNKHTKLVPNDPRGQLFSASIDTVAADHKYDEPIKMSNVANLNTASADFNPVVYMDGIVFTSSRKTPGHNKTYGWTGDNYLDLYFAKKDINNLKFTEVSPFGGSHINQKYQDGPACFSKNFDTMYFSKTERLLKGKDKKTLQIERNKLYVSTMENDNWSKPSTFQYNSDLYSVAHPFLSNDGSKLYFVSDMPGGYGGTDIYYSTRKGNSWSEPINMGPNINTFNNEKYPSIDKEGNFYFSSNGYQGFGGMDICVALNEGGKLGQPKPLKYPFNSSSDDFGILFLKTNEAGYITTNRTESGVGEDDIYYFDISKDNVDKDLLVSNYTIGYRPTPIIEVVIIDKPKKDTLSLPVVTPDVVKTVQSFEGIIYFDFDKSLIRKDENLFLDRVVTYMIASPNSKVILGGHCDERGSTKYNMALSNRRNSATAAYLIKNGINKNRIVSTGYGQSIMVNQCEHGVFCTEPEHQLNRRVEISFEAKKTVSSGD